MHETPIAYVITDPGSISAFGLGLRARAKRPTTKNLFVILIVRITSSLVYSVVMSIPAISINASDASFDLDVLDDFVGYHLQRAAIDVHRTFMNQTGSTRVTPKQFSALVLVGANRDMSQADLGRILAMDRATTTAMIDKLEEGGLVVRHPSKIDRRRHALRLSDSGTSLLTAMKRHATENDAQLTSALTAEERHTLVALLRRVRASVED